LKKKELKKEMAYDPQTKTITTGFAITQGVPGVATVLGVVAAGLWQNLVTYTVPIGQMLTFLQGQDFYVSMLDTAGAVMVPGNTLIRIMKSNNTNSMSVAVWQGMQNEFDTTAVIGASDRTHRPVYARDQEAFAGELIQIQLWNVAAAAVAPTGLLSIFNLKCLQTFVPVSG